VGRRVNTERNESALGRSEQAAEAWYSDQGLKRSGKNGLAAYELALPYVGTAYENPMRLTRQDWRADGEWFDKGQGTSWFDVRFAGRYEITLWFSDVQAADGVAHLKLKTADMSTTITVAEPAVRFAPVELAAGVTTLEGWVESVGDRRSVRYVDIRRLDLPDSIQPVND